MADRLDKLEARREAREKLAQRLDDLETRTQKLEMELAAKDRALQQVTDFVLFTFDKARWDIVSPSAVFDQNARKEQLGFLHACITIWEKIGKETPDDIGKMVLALAGRTEVASAEPK